MTKVELEQRIRSGIPISAQMDFRVLELTDNAIRVSGGGTQNINVHGTAFAGSLYAICTLAVWGMVNSRLPANTSLVMAEGRIHYHKPVIGDIVAHCVIPENEIEDFLGELEHNGKGRLMTVSHVNNEQQLAAEFTAEVYARLNP